MLKVSSRPMEINDFLKVKKHEPYKDQRSKCKIVNFSQIFGGGIFPLSEALDHGGFTEADCDSFIKEVHLDKAFDTMMEKHSDLGERKVKYLTCAQYMKTQFFASYPGLQSRINREVAFAKDNGYVRSWHGPVRHLPQLTLMRYDSKGYPVGVDKMLYARLMSNLNNIAANTAIQTVEVSIVMPSISLIGRHLREWKKIYPFKTRWFNMVHDSIDLYIARDEVEVILSMVKYCTTLRREPFHSIPMTIDAEIADLKKGEYYKHGTEVKIRPFEETMKEFCEKKGIPPLPLLDPIEKGAVRRTNPRAVRMAVSIEKEKPSKEPLRHTSVTL